MAAFRANTTKFPSFKEQIVCDQPSKLKGQKLAKVNTEELICKEPTVSTLTVAIQTSSAMLTSLVVNAKEVTYKKPTTSTLTTVTVSTPLFGNTESHASPTAYSVGSTSIATLPAEIQVSSINPNNGTVTSRYFWYFKHNAGLIACLAGKTNKPAATLASPLAITSDNPGISSSPKPTPGRPIAALIISIWVPVVGFALIGTIIFIMRYKRSDGDPNAFVKSRRTNQTVSVMTSGHDNQCKDVGNNHDQFQAITESNTNAKEVVMAIGQDDHNDDIHNHQDQTRQCQVQAIIETGTISAATAMTSGHDQAQQCMSQTITECNMSQAIGESKNTLNPSYGTNPQTGRVPSQAISEPSCASNPSYGTELTVSQSNSQYQK
ncbi:corticospinal neuron axon guidance through spinal cord [Branchiostoma belcheri]|nr:corticospinal neuron axon guidance through spinal cord [Branchiostoma belcheri]